MKILRVVIYLKESKAEVLVVDRTGKRRLIEVVHFSKDGAFPPPNWLESIEKETEICIERDESIAKGTYLPFG